MAFLRGQFNALKNPDLRKGITMMLELIRDAAPFPEVQAKINTAIHALQEVKSKESLRSMFTDALIMVNYYDAHMNDKNLFSPAEKNIILEQVEKVQNQIDSSPKPTRRGN